MGLPAELLGGRGAARWRKVSDAVAGFLRADGKLAPIYAPDTSDVFVDEPNYRDWKKTEE